MRAPSHRLRSYREDDFAAVARFWSDAWAQVYPEIDFSARLPWLQRHLRALADGGADVLVALDDDDAPCALLTIDPESGALDQLCVAREQQGGGLASRLIGEAMARSPGAVTLEVNDGNARALTLYARHGFAAIGRGVSAAGLATTRMRWSGQGR